MGTKIQKFLAKLAAQDLAKIITAIEKIKAGDFTGLNVKPLKGHKGCFRIRIGRVRIICKISKAGYEILHITNRDDQTYRNY